MRKRLGCSQTNQLSCLGPQAQENPSFKEFQWEFGASVPPKDLPFFTGSPGFSEFLSLQVIRLLTLPGTSEQEQTHSFKKSLPKLLHFPYPAAKGILSASSSTLKARKRRHLFLLQICLLQILQKLPNSVLKQQSNWRLGNISHVFSHRNDSCNLIYSSRLLLQPAQLAPLAATHESPWEVAVSLLPVPWLY